MDMSLVFIASKILDSNVMISGTEGSDHSPAEVKGLDTRGVVNVLELGVGLEDVQHGAVSLPQKFQPRDHHLPVCAFLLSFFGHSRQHDALRGGFRFQVPHLGCFHQGHLGYKTVYATQKEAPVQYIKTSGAVGRRHACMYV